MVWNKKVSNSAEQDRMIIRNRQQDDAFCRALRAALWAQTESCSEGVCAEPGTKDAHHQLSLSRLALRKGTAMARLCDNLKYLTLSTGYSTQNERENAPNKCANAPNTRTTTYPSREPLSSQNGMTRWLRGRRASKEAWQQPVALALLLSLGLGKATETNTILRPRLSARPSC
jgi:hypothetical protein